MVTPRNCRQIFRLSVLRRNITSPISSLLPCPTEGETRMKQFWHPDELAHHWMVSGEEHALLANKTGATRLAFAVLLKAFQYDGRFPEDREDVPHSIVAHLAQQVGVLPDVYAEVDWTGRSSRRHRGDIPDSIELRGNALSPSRFY